MARAHQQRRSARNDQSRRLSAARPTLDDARRDAVGRTAHRHAFGPFGDRRRRPDAIGFRRQFEPRAAYPPRGDPRLCRNAAGYERRRRSADTQPLPEIGRASGMEKMCKLVQVSVVAESLKKNDNEHLIDELTILTSIKLHKKKINKNHKPN